MLCHPSSSPSASLASSPAEDVERDAEGTWGGENFQRIASCKDHAAFMWDDAAEHEEQEKLESHRPCPTHSRTGRRRRRRRQQGKAVKDDADFVVHEEHYLFVSPRWIFVKEGRIIIVPLPSLLLMLRYSLNNRRRLTCRRPRAVAECPLRWDWIGVAGTLSVPFPWNHYYYFCGQ